MKKKTLLIIKIIGFFILLLLGISIIQDIIILIFGNKISYFWLAVIRVVSGVILIYIMLKTTSFGKDINNFLMEMENKSRKKKK